MEDGRDRARRSTRRPRVTPRASGLPESVDDVLTRHGLLPADRPAPDRRAPDGPVPEGPAAARPAGQAAPDPDRAAPDPPDRPAPSPGGRAARRRAAEERERLAPRFPAPGPVPRADRAPRGTTFPGPAPHGLGAPLGDARAPRRTSPDGPAPPRSAPPRSAPDGAPHTSAPHDRPLPEHMPRTAARTPRDAGPAPRTGTRHDPAAQNPVARDRGGITPPPHGPAGYGSPPSRRAPEPDGATHAPAHPRGPEHRPDARAPGGTSRPGPPPDDGRGGDATPAATRSTGTTRGPGRDAAPAGAGRPSTRSTPPRRAGRADPAATTHIPPLTGDAPGDGAAEDVDPAVPDVSERAERSRRADRTDAGRARRIDETLNRLTAAHAGLDLRGAPPPTRRWSLPGPGRLVVLALTVAVVVATSFGYVAKGWLGSAVRDAAALDVDPSSIVDADLQEGDQNVLIVATDSGAAAGAPAAAAGDTVTVAHVPAGDGPLVVLSIPADLEVNRPPCDRFDPATVDYTGETVPAQARTPLVSALGVGGPRCATRVVQQLTGLAITGYVGIDLAGIGAAVDAVSGVDVCLPRPVIDGALGPVAPTTGPTVLDGAVAADVVRAGDVDGDPSPAYGRVERQQQVLAGVLDAALSTTGLLDPGGLAALRPALAASLVADGAGLDQILALALSLSRLDAPGVQFAAVPTAAEVNGRGNVVLRDADAATLFAALREDMPLPAGASDPRAAGTAPADMTVEVVNASDRTGLAAEVRDTLSALGFGVGEVGNATQPTPQTLIRFSPDQAASAGLLAATVPSATPVPDPGTTGVLQLVLGRSFDDVVRAPSEPVAVRTDTSGAPVADCS